VKANSLKPIYQISLGLLEIFSLTGQILCDNNEGMIVVLI